jgi:hypothetical protein
VGATVFFNSANELATLSNTFKVSGTPTDPTAVTLTITSPSNVVTTYTWPTPATLTHGTAGVFSKDIPCNEAGDWQYLWEGTNAASDAETGTWTVFETTLGKLYCSPAALKSRIGITTSGDDYEIHSACFAASRAIEATCERIFYRTATGTVRTVEPTGRYLLKLPAFHDVIFVRRRDVRNNLADDRLPAAARQPGSRTRGEAVHGGQGDRCPNVPVALSPGADPR